MSARGMPHARLDVHVGPGSARPLFCRLPVPILFFPRLGWPAPTLGRSPSPKVLESGCPIFIGQLKHCLRLGKAAIDLRRLICHPQHPSSLSRVRPLPQCPADHSVSAVLSQASASLPFGRSRNVKKSPNTKGRALTPMKPSA